MKKFRFIWIILLICQLNGSAQEVKRIVSLVPWMTKSLYLMGEQDRLVGCSNFCPAEASSHLPIVSTAVNVNLEKILLLKPDLVLVSSLISPETVDNLKKLGIRIEYQTYPRSFDEICNCFIRIGALVGQTEKAKAIVAQQKKRLANLELKVPKGQKPKILMQIGAKPLFCAVPETFMDDFIRFTGGINIASAFKMGSITREYVLKQNPDIIFIVTMGIVAEEERSTWLSYKTLSAGKSKKIFILDADKTCSPTPILFVDALEEMIHLAYN